MGGRSSGGAAARAAGTEAGATLVEVVLATAIVVVVLLSFSGALLGSIAVSSGANEGTIATEAAQREIEALKAMPSSSVFAACSGGRTFAVPGLVKPASGAECGSVRLLSEQELATLTGLSVDLDLDGAIGDAPAAGYRFFPVEVVVTWRARDGAERTIRFVASIYEVPA